MTAAKDNKSFGLYKPDQPADSEKPYSTSLRVVSHKACRHETVNDTEHMVINLDILTCAGNLEFLANSSHHHRYIFEKVDVCDINALRVIHDLRPCAICTLLSNRTWTIGQWVWEYLLAEKLAHPLDSARFCPLLLCYQRFCVCIQKCTDYAPEQDDHFSGMMQKSL